MSEQKYTRVDELKSAIENIPTETRQDAMMIGNVLLKLDMATAYTPAEIMAGMWVPVTERLPEVGEVVIAYESGNTWSTGQFRGLHSLFPAEKSHWLWKHHTLKIVHWWMPKSAVPMPQTPKEEHNG